MEYASNTGVHNFGSSGIIKAYKLNAPNQSGEFSFDQFGNPTIVGYNGKTILKYAIEFQKYGNAEAGLYPYPNHGGYIGKTDRIWKEIYVDDVHADKIESKPNWEGTVTNNKFTAISRNKVVIKDGVLYISVKGTTSEAATAGKYFSLPILPSGYSWADFEGRPVNVSVMFGGTTTLGVARIFLFGSGEGGYAVYLYHTTVTGNTPNAATTLSFEASFLI